MNCPYCGQIIEEGKGAFCPGCGKNITGAGRLNELIEKAKKEPDPVRRHEMLSRAKDEFGERIEIETELLCLGRMYERGGKPDFYRIPSWPLNALEKPQYFSKKERARMLDTFFNNPELERVCGLSGDREALRDLYFGRMAEQYVDLFIKEATPNTMFLGFRRRESEIRRRSGECVRSMLKNLEETGDVPDEIKPRLAKALINAFEAVFGKETSDN